MRARIHNAKPCTVNNCDCWIAVIYLGESKKFKSEDMSPELDTKAEAVEWCKAEFKRRGNPDSPITIRKTLRKKGNGNVDSV